MPYSCTLPVHEIVIPRQGEQCPVVIISYKGYSPPKCTCHGKQSLSSKYMILLECLHAQTHVSSPHRLPHTCLSQMRVKSQFSKQKLFVLENLLPRFSKYIGLPSETNLLDNPPKQLMGPFDVNCWTTSQHNSLKNLPSKFLSQTIFFSFYFPSCHALTPNILGCPSAYGMHYANSKIFMLIYKTCIY